MPKHFTSRLLCLFVVYCQLVVVTWALAGVRLTNESGQFSNGAVEVNLSFSICLICVCVLCVCMCACPGSGLHCFLPEGQLKVKTLRRTDTAQIGTTFMGCDSVGRQCASEAPSHYQSKTHLFCQRWDTTGLNTQKSISFFFSLY